MPPQELIGLTPKEYETVVLMAQEYDSRRTRRIDAQQVLPSGANVQFVKVSSATADTSAGYARYPARWYEIDPAVGVLAGQSAVWLAFVNGDAPQAGLYYHAHSQGADANGVPIFWTAGCACADPSACSCPCNWDGGKIWGVHGGTISTTDNPFTVSGPVEACLGKGLACCSWDGPLALAGSYTGGDLEAVSLTLYLAYDAGSTTWTLTLVVFDGNTGEEYAAATWAFTGTIDCAGDNTFASTFARAGWTAPATLTVNNTCATTSGGSGSGASGGVSSTEWGGTTTGSGTASSLTLFNVGLAAGELLLVKVGVLGADTVTGVTFNGVALRKVFGNFYLDNDVALGNLSLWGSDLTGVTAGTGSVVASFSGACAAVLAAETVAGLPFGTLATGSSSFGLTPGQAPDTGVIFTASGPAFVTAAFLLRHTTAGFGFGSWAGGFTADQQQTATGGGDTLGLEDGDAPAPAAGNFDATLTGVPTSTSWCGLVVAYT